MSGPTTIEWTGATWNPVTGCTKISAGCDHCYAETIARRFAGGPAFPDGFAVTLHPDRLTAPLRRKAPTTYFVDSMGDLFHDQVPNEFLIRVFTVMAATPWHTYQILTKRPGRMRAFLADECRCGAGHAPGIHLRSAMAWAASTANPDRIDGTDEHQVYDAAGWPLPNVWIGSSAENQHWADIRIPALLDTPATCRFVSAEPLLGSIDLTQAAGPGRVGLAGLDWVIVGGESGPGARPVELDWIRSIRDQCVRAGLPVFVKQLGRRWATATGTATGKGGDPATWPADLRVRQMPMTTAELAARQKAVMVDPATGQTSITVNGQAVVAEPLGHGEPTGVVLWTHALHDTDAARFAYAYAYATHPTAGWLQPIDLPTTDQVTRGWAGWRAPTGRERELLDSDEPVWDVTDHPEPGYRPAVLVDLP